MGQEINISILQMGSIIGDIEANCNKIQKIIENELQTNTDVLVLPEVWPIGWSCSEFISSAENISNSTVISFLKSIALKYKINIIGGSFINKRDNNYYNTCPVIDKYGKLIATYDKNHLYSYYGCDEGSYVTSGDFPVMVSIEGVNFGLSICYDIRFPEIYRAYAKAGADILVNCAAWGSNKPISWEMMTKSRAIENQCYMIALTQCGQIKDNEYNLGESRIIDYKGEEICSIMHREGIATCTISLPEMYEFRNKCKVLNDIKNNYEVKTLCVK